MLKKILATMLILIVSLSLVACGNKKGDNRDPEIGKNGTLKITYYKGGTGSFWIEELAMAFENETKIKVELTDDAQATENALTLLESNRNLPDLMFILYTNWQKFVQKGYLAPMDDLYDGTFSATYGDATITSKYDVAGTSVYAADSAKGSTGLTAADIFEPEYLNYGKTSKTATSEKHFWVMPWTSGTTGIVYNVDMLASVGYTNPPATYEELLDCCQKLTDKGIAPFAWGGEEFGYWDFVTMGWWAQYSGVEKWESFYKFENVDVFKDPGRVEALKAWKNLIVSNGTWKNSINAPMGRDHNDAHRVFVSGEAAMCPTGSWIETEVGKFLPKGFNMAMMPTPAIKGAKTDENGNVIQVCNTEAGDVGLIPKNAANVTAAKAFLAFMNRPEWIEKFTQYTGMPRPFLYQPSKLQGLSSFSKSCMEYYENSEKMWRVSDSPIYTYAGIRHWEPLGAATLYGNLVNSEPSALCEQMYNSARGKWDIWLKMV
ncbi:MAG: extracellular solute-binding protein [Clostridia bacterium]|nr:extracellular solute-binding protein [Clostridia bacterium]